MEDSPAVFIMGADTLTGLTTARSMKSLPVKIIGIYEQADSVTLASNSWDRLYRVSGEIRKQFDDIVRIKNNNHNAQKAILLFTSDDQVMAYWDFGQELSEVFIVPIVDSKKGQHLMDKTLFHEWAVKENVPVPPSLPLNGIEDLKKAKRFSSFPCILKPMVRRQSWNKKYPNKKILKFRNAYELSDFLESEDIFNFSKSYILQKWIEGRDSDIYFVLYAHDLNGKLIGKVGGRKILQWPPLEGSTAVCELYNDKSLINIADQITEKMELIGLNSLEFKKDSVDGSFYITEPTVGRNDYQSGLSLLARPALTDKLIRSILELNSIKVTSSLPFKGGLWIDEIAVLRYIKGKNIWFVFRLLILLIKNKLRLSFLLFSLKDWRPFTKRILPQRRR